MLAVSPPELCPAVAVSGSSRVAEGLNSKMATGVRAWHGPRALLRCHFCILGFRLKTVAWRGTKRPSPSRGGDQGLEQLATCPGHKRGRQGRDRRNLYFDPAVSSGTHDSSCRASTASTRTISPDIWPRSARLHELMWPCFRERLSLLCCRGHPPHTCSRTASQREVQAQDRVPRVTSPCPAAPHTDAEKPDSLPRKKQGRRSAPA